MLPVKFNKDHLNDAVDNIYQVNIVDDAEVPQSLLVKKQKVFENVENIGSEINYKCNKCRTCKIYKQHSTGEIMSAKEKLEQDVINNSVKVDVASQKQLPLYH